MLQRNKVAPRLYFHGLARKSGAPVYGAKFLSYQMVQTHRMRDPGGFLRQLAADGVLLVHLKRGTFFQTLSLTVAQMRLQYHSDRGARAPSRRLHFDPQDFVARIAWNEALIEYERRAFEGVPHVSLSYERDLATPDVQQATLAHLCERLGLAPEPATIHLKKVLPGDPDRVIDNYEEISAAMKAAGYGHLLPAVADV